MTTQLFFIASLKHTGKEHEHITWWGPAWRGYTPVAGECIGRYTLEDAMQLNDGYDTLAVPCEAVEALLSPEPYYVVGSTGIAARFFDQRGPVVDNTRAKWKALIAAALPGRKHEPKPEACTKRRRRSCALADIGVAA